MPCLDPEIINELQDILGEDLNAVADEFVDQLREQIVPLRAAQEAQDWSEVARIAHLLKGSAGNLGASALAAQILSLERAARAGEGDAVAREFAAALELSESCIGELAARALLSS
ncbi:TMAO reductase sytem sensor TorS [Thiorhodovibrio winogradskyi]|uniref:TMAO reductase sytem sensor TorS n=1 Tax=Thiorhodovibrio winogradskyi TaxID=77007 RepID=A0ABZ0SAN7_9GAMM|nr:Hpt domain-containing protein [Thiorhodovibrio winogradskyi]